MGTKFNEGDDGGKGEGVEYIIVLLFHFAYNSREYLSKFGLINDGMVDFSKPEYNRQIYLVITDHPAAILFPHFEEVGVGLLDDKWSQGISIVRGVDGVDEFAGDVFPTDSEHFGLEVGDLGRGEFVVGEVDEEMGG